MFSICRHLFIQLELEVDILRLRLVPKKICAVSVHRIFGHMHEALNAIEKNN